MRYGDVYMHVGILRADDFVEVRTKGECFV